MRSVLYYATKASQLSFGPAERSTYLASKIYICLMKTIVIAMNDVERAMEKLGYLLYKGEVYKKVQSSKYTFKHCCTFKKFL